MPARPAIRMLQTADPFVYRDMLHSTQQVNTLFCERQGLRYEAFVGIKQGVCPWQATYNRIFMLNELLDSGFDGWVFYVDADAFISDLTFDIYNFLATIGDYCFVGERGGTDQTPWNINAGVFFLDCRDPDGRFLIRDWLRRFREDVPEHYLRSRSARWDDYPNDQELMYRCLIGSPSLLRKTRRLDTGFMNYTNGSFVRQAIRVAYATLHDRLRWIDDETATLLATAHAEAAAPGEPDGVEHATADIDFEVSFRTGGNSALYAKSGFSVQERSGCWMIGEESILEIPPPPGLAADGRIEAELVVTPAIRPGTIDKQGVRLFVNDTELFDTEITGHAVLRFGIQAEQIAYASPIVIRIEHPDHIRHDPTYTGDDREFALLAWSLNMTARGNRHWRGSVHQDEVIRPVFQIRPRGNVGNIMFQHMVAVSVQERVPDCEIAGTELNDWTINTLDGVTEWAEIAVRSLHRMDVPQIARRLRTEPALRLSYDGSGMRLENLLHAEAYRKLFAHTPGVAWQSFDDRFVVINIRGGDKLSGHYPDHTLLPIGFYRDVVDELGRIPVFLGQLEDNVYVEALKRAFPGGVFLHSAGPAADFQTLRTSRNIVVAVSVFSWLAAWLSDASVIVLPIAGFFNPEQAPEIDLLPSDDHRYRFYKFPVYRAVHVSLALEQLDRLDGTWKRVTSGDVSDIRRSR